MPAVPKAGDPLTIYVTILNKGDQGVSNIPVEVYEGSTLLGSRSISYLSGNNQSVLTFNYDTTGKTGTQEISVIVGPVDGIVEQSEENNRASKTLGVNDSNQWVTEPYISPNGDGVKDSTQVFFQLETPTTVSINIIDEIGETVRTFSSTEFANAASGSIIWNGFGDNGMVVDDGQYQAKVTDGSGRILSSVVIVVDNNRSPLTKAVGTKYLLKQDMECKTLTASWLSSILSYLGGTDGSYTSSLWLPDESEIIISTNAYLGPELDTLTAQGGVFILSADGNALEEISTDQWKEGRYIYSMVLSSDGKKAAFVTSYGWLMEIWILDLSSKKMALLDTLDSQSKYSYIDHILRIAPNNAYVSYRIWKHTFDYTQWVSTTHVELWTVDGLGTNRSKISEMDNFDWGLWTNAPLWHSWSPDGQRIFYLYSQQDVWSSDPLGANQKHFSAIESYLGSLPDFVWLNDRQIVAFTMEGVIPGFTKELAVIDTQNGEKLVLGQVYGHFLNGIDRSDFPF